MKSKCCNNNSTIANTTISDRLILLAKKLGFDNVNKFEIASELPTGYVRKAKVITKPRQMQLQSIYPNVNIEWLLSGKGEMLRENNVPPTIQPELPKEATKKDPQSKIVPLIPISAQGGSLNDFSISVMNYECEKVVSPMMDVDFAISISGDSMAPEYPSGCQVLIKRINESAFIEWGKVYVLDTCNGTIIKKLMPSESSDRVVCVSINPAYPQFEVAFKYIQGIYRVMMVMAVK